MSTNAGVLLARHDEQNRGRMSARPLLGAVVEQFGPALVTHYGTHSVVETAALPTTAQDSIADAVTEVRSSMAARVEPVEWRVYAHDPTATKLAQKLVAAGFTPGWQRGALVAEIDDIAVPELPGKSWKVESLWYGTRQCEADVVNLAQRSGPHRVALSEWLDVGRPRTWCIEIAALSEHSRVVAVGWAENVADTQFIAIGGMSAPRTELLSAWVDWTRSWFMHRRKRYLTADADGALREALIGSGFHEVTAVQSFHLSPPGTPKATPPVKQMIDDAEDEGVRDRVTARLGF